VFIDVFRKTAVRIRHHGNRSAHGLSGDTYIKGHADPSDDGNVKQRSSQVDMKMTVGDNDARVTSLTSSEQSTSGEDTSLPV